MNAKHLWFKCSIAAGSLLSVLLLIETFITYRYVEGDLVRLEVRREAGRHVRSIERAVRVNRISDPSQIAPILREIEAQNLNHLAWIRVLGKDGHVVAATGSVDHGSSYSQEALRNAAHQPSVSEKQTTSGLVVAVLGPLVLRSPDNLPASRGVSSPPESELIEVAIYLQDISINFGPLRQNLTVGVSTALALMGAVMLIALRFGDYVRAKQTETEIAIARQVQMDLLLADPVVATEVHFAARCIPAWEVGGDLYDVFDTDDGQTAFVLGDVSGKGVSAGLLMGLVEGAVRASGTMASPSDHERAVERLNKLLCRKTGKERFVTLFWSYFSANKGSLRYINAGHCPPLLVQYGANRTEILRLENAGPVLGVIRNTVYKQAEIAVRRGDLLIMCSDGILEASDALGEEFGEERLIAAIEMNRMKSPAEICEAILANVRSFAEQEAQMDDQTLLVAQLEPRPAKRASFEQIVAVQALEV